VIKKILIILFIYTISANSFSEDNDVLMRMYERLEMIRTQMQQLTEENQQLNNKLSSLQDQQDRLYQDLSKKIQILQDELNKKNNNITADKSVLKEKINTDIDKALISEKKSKINEGSSKQIESVIPKDENELDLAKPYVNNNFKKKLKEYKSKNEIELYRSAFQLIKDKKYEESIDSFNAFLYLFPESKYSSNAQYWLSESIYALGDYVNSMINFAKVVENYPNSSKIADAKLKIGYCYYSIKKWKEARFIFSSIMKDYPNTSLSQLADKKISSMDVEGR
jgi:tol-pal system protein YbgF